MEAIKDVSVGWLAGALGIAATHPLGSISSVAQSIYKNGGMPSFFRGIAPPLIFRGCSFAVLQGVMGDLDRRSPEPWSSKNPIKRAAITGSMGAIVAGIVEIPMYVIKCRSQVSNAAVNESFRATFATGQSIVSQVGWRGLYIGLTPHLAMVSISWGLMYGVYEWGVQRGYSPSLTGALAAVMCWPAAYPFDVLRTKIQVMDPKKGLNYRYIPTFTKFFSRPIPELYAGLSPTLLRAFPRFYITFLTMDMLKSL